MAHSIGPPSGPAASQGLRPGPRTGSGTASRRRWRPRSHTTPPTPAAIAGPASSSQAPGVPGLTIVDPCDALDIEQAVPQIAEHKGPVYMRLLRGSVPLVLDQIEGGIDHYRFELVKAKLLREGAGVLVIASGIMTMRALEVAQDLARDGAGVAVLHCPTIKPLDEAAIVEAVRYRHRLVVVAENHSVIGGLGEAVSSALLRHRVQPAGFHLAGLPDAFLDAGALPTPHDRYGISRQVLGQRIKGWLG